MALTDCERTGRARVCEVDGNIASAARAFHQRLSENELTLEHIHALTNSLVRQNMAAGYCCLAEIFVRLMCLQEDGIYREPQDASRLIAFLSWVFRASEFWHLFEKSKQGHDMESYV
jgi:hypothetical protein